MAVRILVWAAFFILRATMGWFVFIKENKNFQVIKEKKLCIKIRQYRNLKYFFAKEKQFSGEFFFNEISTFFADKKTSGILFFHSFMNYDHFSKGNGCFAISSSLTACQALKILWQRLFKKRVLRTHSDVDDFLLLNSSWNWTWNQYANLCPQLVERCFLSAKYFLTH